MARCGWCGQTNLEFTENDSTVLKGHGKPGSTSQQLCRGQEEQYAILVDRKGQDITK